MKKVELCLPDNLFEILKKISENKGILLDVLIIEDLNNLVRYYNEQLDSIGLSFL